MGFFCLLSENLCPWCFVLRLPGIWVTHSAVEARRELTDKSISDTAGPCLRLSDKPSISRSWHPPESGSKKGIRGIRTGAIYLSPPRGAQHSGSLTYFHWITSYFIILLFIYERLLNSLV
jgi:hypothetical protein